MARGSLTGVDLSKFAAGGKTVLGLVDGEGGKFPEWVEPWDVRALPAAADFTPFAGMNTDDVMTVVYTSGMTSVPSGVVYRIGSMIDNARLSNRRMGIGADNRFYGVLISLEPHYIFWLAPWLGEEQWPFTVLTENT